MNHQAALALANDMLRAFIESQDIPPGGTTGTAASHGQKTAEFLAALHRTLYDHFRTLEDPGTHPRLRRSRAGPGDAPPIKALEGRPRGRTPG